MRTPTSPPVIVIDPNMVGPHETVPIRRSELPASAEAGMLVVAREDESGVEWWAEVHVLGEHIAYLFVHWDSMVETGDGTDLS